MPGYTVQFWAFAKKPNSTKRPTAAGTSYLCDIMDPTGILAPVVDLKLAPDASPIGFNYAFIDVWNRYYYIRDWYYINGIWRAQFQIDVLASWKNEIGSQTAYIARSSAAMNGRIGDSTYPILAGNTSQVIQNNANPFATSYPNGWFIVGIINSDSSAIGGVSYYGMTNAEFQTFRALLFGDITYLGTITDLEPAVVKMLANPFQYVASVMWVPFDPGFLNTVNTLTFGYWSVNCQAHRVTYPRAAGTISIAVPKHPLAVSRGYWLLCEPYSSYYMDFPPFGSFTVHADRLVDTDNLSMFWDCDIITGKGRLTLMDGNGTVIDIIQGQIGVPVQIASAAPDVGGILNQMLDGISAPANVSEATTTTKASLQTSMMNMLPDEAAAQGMAIFAESQVTEPVTLDTAGSDRMKSFATNIVSAVVQHFYPMQSLGNNGGFMGGYYPIRLVGVFARIADDCTADRGRPLCEYRQISTIPGFIQVGDAHMEISGTLAEIEELNQTAAAGFFYE